MLIKPLTREALFINKTDIQAGKIKCFHASNLLIYCINNEGQKGQGKEGEIKTHPGQSPCCDTPAPPRGLGEASPEVGETPQGHLGARQSCVGDQKKVQINPTTPLTPPSVSEKMQRSCSRSIINTSTFSCDVSLNLTIYFHVFLNKKDGSGN